MHVEFDNKALLLLLYVNTWRGHGFIQLSPLGRQPHNPNLARTPLFYTSLTRGIHFFA